MQIAYEQIDSEYWYGRYGPFKVVIHSLSGYINASKLCSDNFKQFRHWKENKSSQELIDAVEKRIEFHKPILPDHMSIALPTNAIFEEKGLTSRGNETRGLYAHSLLVPHIASWANPRFAIFVSEIVNDYLSSAYKWFIMQQDLIIQQKDLAIQGKDVEIEQKDDEIQDKNFEIEAKDFEIQEISSILQLDENIIDHIKPKVVPDTKDPAKRMIFALFRVDSSLTTYWAIRCQEVNFPKQVKSAQAKLGSITQIYKVVDPNSFNLFIRIKEQGKDLFNWKRNLITLKDMSYEMGLIALVDNLVHNRM